MKKITKSCLKPFLFISFLCTLSSCSFFLEESDDKSSTKENTKIKEISVTPSNTDINYENKANNAPTIQQKQITKTSNVEVKWTSHGNIPDGFIIGYGFQQDKMIGTVRLATNEIAISQDPVYGNVFKYTLKDMPSDRPLFVRIVTFKGNVYSKPSKPMMIRAN